MGGVLALVGGVAGSWLTLRVQDRQWKHTAVIEVLPMLASLPYSLWEHDDEPLAARIVEVELRLLHLGVPVPLVEELVAAAREGMETRQWDTTEEGQPSSWHVQARPVARMLEVTQPIIEHLRRL